MHELSLCQALIDQVERLAAQHRASAVASITLRVGPLSGVVPELLQHAFSVARAGTVADQAQLLIEHQPVVIRCRNCGAENQAEPNRLVCPACGGWQTEVISGEEMLLASLELLEPAD